MLVYAKLNSFFSSFIKTDKNYNENNLESIMKLYVWLNKNYSTSFYYFAEIYYIFSKFNSISYNIINTVYLFIFNSSKITLTPVYISVLKNNSLIYFFNSVSLHKLSTTLNKVKTLQTNITTILSTNYTIRYSPTNVAKYLHNNYIKLVEVLYLRKNKVFNKGRYSRNRQFYRTGVYWCLYINIIAIVGLYFWFYRFVMNFGYLWWLLYLSLAIFLLAKSLNYNLLNPINLVKSIKSDLYFFIYTLSPLTKILNSTLLLIQSRLSNIKFNNSKLIINLININILFIKSLFNFVFQYDTSFKLFKCNLENYYIYSITLNYNRVFLNTKKYKFSSMFTREFTQIDL